MRKNIFSGLNKIPMILIIVFFVSMATNAEVLKLNLLKPTALKYYKGNLYIVDSPAKIVKLNLKTMKTIGFGRKGQGPGEFHDILGLQVYKDTLYVFSQNGVTSFNLNGVFKKIHRFPQTGIHEFVILDGNFYINKIAFGQSDIIDVYSVNGKKLFSFKKPVNQNMNLPGGKSFYYTIYQNYFRIARFKDKIALASVIGDKIEIYDKKGKYLYNIKLPVKPVKIELTKKNILKNVSILKIKWTNSKLYAVLASKDKTILLVKIEDNKPKIIKKFKKPFIDFDIYDGNIFLINENFEIEKDKL